MKLGIVVVYLFSEECAPLLDLHLRHIERHTGVPYTIYAGVNRLAPHFRDALAGHPGVRICECPETSLRGMEEHAHYLDHLVRIAVEDGATHVVTLHLDSFPVRSGWAEELAGRLSPPCVLATLDRINTACLFFHRDFFVANRPSFLLSPAETETAGYRRYIEECDPMLHSGIGYGFMAYRNGKSVYYLRDTSGADPYTAGKVYDDMSMHDDMIFHLGSAVRIGGRYPREPGGIRVPGWAALMKAATAVSMRLIPGPVRKFIMEYLGSFIENVVFKPQFVSHAQRIRRFMGDPEKYLALLRKADRSGATSENRP